MHAYKDHEQKQISNVEFMLNQFYYLMVELRVVCLVQDFTRLNMSFELVDRD